MDAWKKRAAVPAYLAIALGCLTASSGCNKGETASPPAKTADTKYAEAPLDPVVTNGPIFEGWPQPKLAIVISGGQHGYLEPCGCTGRENQKGGLMRRATMLDERRQAGWELLPIELGGLVRRYGPQAEIQFQTTANALREMQYAAATLGEEDARLAASGLVTAVDEGDAKKESLFVSANVGIFGFESAFTPRFRIIERAGMRIGITGILGAAYTEHVNNPELEVIDPVKALEQVLPDLEGKCDVLILLSNAPPEESLELAKRFPMFDIVVTAGGADEPPAQPTQIEDSDRMLVDVGGKGMYVGVIGLYGSDQPSRYQRVPIDARFADDPKIKTRFKEYQDQLRLAGFENLGARPVEFPNASGGESLFAGSESCGSCHKQAFAKWSQTPHAQATASLMKQDPQRQFDPECVSCHATGWNPQEYFPFVGGYESHELTPHLEGNGCENCHGPGKAHVVAETDRMNVDLGQRETLRQSMRLTKATADTGTCAKCHDLDNSPHFNFPNYWPKVEHPWKD